MREPASRTEGNPTTSTKKSPDQTLPAFGAPFLKQKTWGEDQGDVTELGKEGTVTTQNFAGTSPVDAKTPSTDSARGGDRHSAIWECSQRQKNLRTDGKAKVKTLGLASRTFLVISAGATIQQGRGIDWSTSHTIQKKKSRGPKGSYPDFEEKNGDKGEYTGTSL